MQNYSFERYYDAFLNSKVVGVGEQISYANNAAAIELREPLQAIGLLSDDELANLYANYRAKGKATGGIHSLLEVITEMEARKAPADDGRELVKVMVAMCARSFDNRLTIGDIRKCVVAVPSVEGMSWRAVAYEALRTMIEYCVYAQLPIFPALIVRFKDSCLQEKHIKFVYDVCHACGCDVGPSAETFVARQVALALHFIKAKSSSH